VPGVLSHHFLERGYSADSNGNQPGGLSDGSRWSLRARGERPPERRRMVQHPEEGCQTQPPDECTALHSGTPGPMSSQRVLGLDKALAQFSGATPISIPRGSKESGTPPGCKTHPAPLPGGRRPQKTSATSGYRLANPSGCLIQNLHTPGLFPTPSWSADILPTRMEANPEGCQTVAGGRSGQRGERPPEKRVGWLSTPERGARPNQATIGWQSHLARRPHSKYLGSYWTWCFSRSSRISCSKVRWR
jgi:hypothetical protein